MAPSSATTDLAQHAVPPEIAPDFWIPVACQSCGSWDCRTVSVVSDCRYDTGVTGRFVECRACGLVYLSPRPRDLGTLYRTHYREASPTKHRPLVHRAWRRYLASLWRWICGEYEVPALLPGTRFLDVGCGDGAAIRQATARGAKAAGLEIDEENVNKLRLEGLDVRCGRIEEQGEAGEQFEVVWLSQVLEHVERPVEILSACAKLLSPAGEILVWCPNGHSVFRRLFGRFWNGWYVPFHLFVFDLVSLRNTAHAAGLEVAATWTVTPSSFLVTSLAGGLPRLRGAIANGLLRRALMLTTAPIGRSIDLFLPGRGDCLCCKLVKPAPTVQNPL